MTELTGELQSPSALQELLNEANRSPFIGYLSMNDLQLLIDMRTIRFVYVDGVLAGFGGWIIINADWVEIGPFFVSERFQGQGLGRLIVQQIIILCQEQTQNQYAVTRNPVVKHILPNEGFHTVKLLKLPLSLQLYIIRKLSLIKIFNFLKKPISESVNHFVNADIPANRKAI